ncbi:MAG: cytochrome c biogenesis protein CcdA, partial [Rhodobacteraceae bacterium]|nr:cytochrome c biogenesis protein CcdA [Paracoccaceae bacterium]
MFDPSFLTGGFPLAAFVALLAGVLSFVSPCVLPVVPSYLAYMAGIGMGEMEGQARARRAALLAAVFFVLGLSTVFLLLGIAASALGRFLLQNQDWFSTGAGIVVMIFGAHFIGVFRIPFLDREARIDAGDRG